MVITTLKRAFAVAAAGILTCALTACQSAGTDSARTVEPTAVQPKESAALAVENAEVSKSTETEGQETQETDSRETEDTGLGSSLVVYFSWSGNTRNVAEEIGKQMGADLFELVPANPYSEDYDTVLGEA